MAQRFTVRVVELGIDRPTHEARVLASDERAAEGKALAKLFGSRAFWQPDSGLGPAYGQVFEALPNSGGWQATSRTYRARLDVHAGW